jgi:hypothetical protein
MLVLTLTRGAMLRYLLEYYLTEWDQLQMIVRVSFKINKKTLHDVIFNNTISMVVFQIVNSSTADLTSAKGPSC